MRNFLSGLGIAIILTSCTTPGNNNMVPYPHNNNTGIDSTKPVLAINAYAYSGSHGASGKTFVDVTTTPPIVNGGMLDMNHLSGGQPDERTLVVNISATDPESGIAHVRLSGNFSVCTADGLRINFGDKVYYEQDFVGGGATSVPVTVANAINVPIYAMMHPLDSQTNLRRNGDSGWFQFSLETFSGSSTLNVQNFTQTLSYSVGTNACP